MSTSAFGVEDSRLAKGLAPGMAPLASNGGGVDMVGAGAKHTGKQAAVYQAKKQKKFPRASSHFSGSPLYSESGRVGLVGDGARHTGRLSAGARVKRAAALTEGLAKGYPLGSTAARAEEVLRADHASGAHSRKLVQNCRQCQHKGRVDLLRAKMDSQGIER